MKIGLEIKGMPNQSRLEVAALVASRCTAFFNGWMKRFGDALKLFVFPF